MMIPSRLALVLATATAFQGPLARAPAHKAPAAAQRGPRGWFTSLRAAVADPVQQKDRLAEYVAEKGGTRIIRKVLIANNGMAATKSIMSMRRWAYLELGDEKALEFIVMATPEDLNANAEFVRLADEYVEVPGGSNTNNYANVKLIVDTASRLGVDAVWPGWGHASENPKLPTALKEKGIAFMGPPAPVMSVLGDKIAANILAQTAKVPSIPWSGSFGNPGDDGPLQANLQADGTIPKETFEAGCVHSAAEALEAAERVKYPVMLKASEGGGGKGIRMCKDAAELEAAFPQVEQEQPGSPIFVMQLMTGARHLEVQVVGDEHGNAVALNGRDCSTQRRFQKIFEEAPPTKPSGGIASPEVFADMELKAKQLVQNIGYVGAGTVEYLYNAKNDDYFFLELNPRLQVEHPCTEGVTGVNLPATQLQVAMGIPLPQMPEVRRLYGIAEGDTSTVLDLDDPDTKYGTIKKHVMAARITAENPDEGFKPTSGRIERVSFQSTPAVWGYFSVGANGGVHEFADSQFGHLFATGDDREAARKALVLALKELKVRGEIRNPVEYLVQLLETDDFKNNDIDTAWLDGILAAKSINMHVDDSVVVASAALYRAHEACKAARLEFEAALERGQFSTNALDALDNFDLDIVVSDVKYTVNVQRTGDASFDLSTNGGASLATSVREQPDGTLLASYGGVSHQLTGQEDPLGLRIIVDGASVFVPAAFDPSEIRSDVTGKIVRWLKEDGESVAKGETFAEVEAMKMIMPLKAADAGKVSPQMAAGSVIEAGNLLANLELDDPSKARKISVFEGDSIGLEEVSEREEDALLSYRALFDKLGTAMDGYDTINGDSSEAVAALVKAISDPDVFRLQVREVAGAIGQKMPAELDAALAKVAASIDVAGLNNALEAYENDAALESLRVLAAQWAGGAAGVAAVSVADLLDRFLLVEEKFVGRADEDAATRELIKASSKKIAADVLLAHAKLKARSDLARALVAAVPRVQALSGKATDDERTRLERELDRVAALEAAGPGYATVSLAAGMARLRQDIPPFESRLSSLKKDLEKSKDIVEFASNPQLGSYTRGVDLLTELFDDSSVAEKAAEVYVRRMYSAHDILYLKVTTSNNKLEASWWYKFRNDEAAKSPLRFGKLVLFDDAASAVAGLSATVEGFGDELRTGLETHSSWVADASDETPVNTIHLLLKSNEATTDDKALVATLEQALAGVQNAVEAARLRSVNFVATDAPYYPRYFTFVNPTCIESGASAGPYREDPLRRGMRPTFYHLLELGAVERNFLTTPLPTVNRDLRVYVGDDRAGRAKNPKFAAQSVFVRRLTHSPDFFDGGCARLLDKALDALDMALLDARVKPTAAGRVFINVIPPVEFDSVSDLDTEFQKTLGGYLAARATRLLAARVDEIEVKFAFRTPTGVIPVRGVATSAEGPWLALRTYVERVDPVTGVTLSYCDVDGENCVVEPYPAADAVSKKRATARRIGTTYAYDFVGLLATAQLQAWRNRKVEIEAYGGAIEIPSADQVVEAKELLFDDDAEYGVSTKGSRPVGTNDVGMVGFSCTFRTPEYPDGREVVIVANDVTYQSGSFGVLEDDFFAKVTRFAADRGVPRVYLSSNSGARIGLVEALKPLVGVKWVSNDPSKGLEYLYVTPEDLANLPEGSVDVKPKNRNGHHEIEAIIGSDDQVPDGIGVENLRGSGTIAGATSRAYEETFTLSYVSGRSVGIGAYLNRLGQRVIQMKTGPMILTGYQALNKLLGKAVYTSQDQLGGQQIMMPNGITHMGVDDDYEGCEAIVRWLSYVPSTAKDLVPGTLAVTDPVDRPVTSRPPADGSPYDIRELLDNADGTGLFDKGSFTETLAGWGKTVVAGRAKLGGIPFGVISVETRTVEAVVPADPANPDSRESIKPQAGQVWYPDSAHKTAQAIADFGRGEKLPLMILANWRGFSGGTRDMYDEVLKFGAKIVDELTKYDMPVFVYIPPKAELRGGAWVVVDPTINADFMEMYADPESRGGILEPPGICEVKFRAPDQRKVMARTDSELVKLNAKPQSAERDAAIAKREAILAPLYQQVAIEFADLHDRAGRMKAKGVIRDVVAWEGARSYFYKRAARRLAVDALAKGIVNTGGTLEDATAKVEAFCQCDWADDEAVLKYLEANAEQAGAMVHAAETEALVAKLKGIFAGRADAGALVAAAMA